MRFQFTTSFLLLIHASSSSSFGNYGEKVHYGRHRHRVPFVCGGGVQGSARSDLFASVGTPPASTIDVSSSNLALLSERGRNAILNLIENDSEGAQRHVYGNWPEAGNDDEGKVRLAEQVRTDT